MPETLAVRVPVVIDRRWWIRGDKFSLMRRAPDNKMCCLGHVAVACDVPSIIMNGCGTPRSVWELMSARGLPIPDNFNVLEKHPFTPSLMRINDASFYREIDTVFGSIKLESNAQRETAIAAALSLIGFDVTFVN